MADGCKLRPATDDDLEFLYRVYAGTRADEMAIVPWTDEEKESFLRQQFNAQRTHYLANYAGARYEVILVDDQPAGRLYLHWREDELRIMDIALLSEYRGRGIGGRLMQDLLDEAAAAGKRVRIHVECNNPARRLYDRLGFRQIDDLGVYHLLEWRSETSE
jgi:ribosomal protein S18 acetylase RimI-like enzyme